MPDSCDHIIGTHGGLTGGGMDLGAAGALVRASQTDKIIMDARDFYEIVAQQDYQLIGYNLKGKRLAEAIAKVNEVMAAWDSRPLADKLKGNCALFAYCPQCGAKLWQGEDHTVKTEEMVRVRRYRTK